MSLARSRLAAFAILAGLASTIAVQHQSYSRHREENLALRQQAAQLDEPHAASQPLATPEPQPVSTSSPAEDQQQELERLRAKVSGLKKQLAESGDALNQLRAARRDAFASNAAEVEAFKQLLMSKKQMLDECVPAFMAAVAKNEGQFPSSFEQARPLLSAEAQPGISLLAQNFELTFQGSLTNLSDPSRVIVMRLRQPLQTPAKGAWFRAYVFADGHSDIHLAQDGDFNTWEQQHSPGAGGR